MTRHLSILSAAVGAAFLMTPLAVAKADPVADFFKRKRVTIWVGFSAGGGYDRYARAVARHLGQNIPGKPRVIVKNKPGAGGMILANDLYNTLPKDGTAIATLARGMPMEPLLGNPEAKFDPVKFTWLGSANNEVSVCATWYKSKIKTVDDMMTKKWNAGGVGPGSDTDTFPRAMNNMFGAKIKVVTGYPGGADINLAIERGELDGRCGWSWSSVKSTRPKWLKEKKINLLIQMSTEKHPELPNVPFVLDYAKSEKDRKVLELIYARQVWGRPFFGPPGIPADRAKALQDAFMATMKDPKFLAEAEKQKLDIAPVSGPAIQKMMVKVYQSPKDVVEGAKIAVSDETKTEVAKAVIPVETLKGKITALKGDGRQVTVEGGGKTQKVSVSGSKTTIMVGGQKAKRKALKVGMSCELTYQGSAAKQFVCG